MPGNILCLTQCGMFFAHPFPLISVVKNIDIDYVQLSPTLGTIIYY